MSNSHLDLPAALDRAHEHALAAGALLPIRVEGETVSDGGVDFRVEWISSLAMKDLARLVPKAGDKAQGANPFLPFDPDLHVADLSETHVAILNKFPVWRGHFLLITRDFVDQETPLSIEDCDALLAGMRSVQGFTFYNSGLDSGASQRHRHLQIVPGYTPPIEAILPSEGAIHAVGRAAAAPFEHAFSRIDLSELDAADLLRLVDQACEAVALPVVGGVRPPYNLLMTRTWLMIVPRRVEHAAGVSVSALGYAGMIGLRSGEQLAAVREHGPMRMLIHAAGRR